MKLASLAIGGCAAALALGALQAQASGHRGSFGGGVSHGHAVVGHAHFGHSRVFIGGTFFVSPFPYYYAPAYYYPPYAPAVAAPPPQYWYYCPAAAAYYPYVQYCPGGWQLVMPSAGPGPY